MFHACLFKLTSRVKSFYRAHEALLTEKCMNPLLGIRLFMWQSRRMNSRIGASWCSKMRGSWARMIYDYSTGNTAGWFVCLMEISWHLNPESRDREQKMSLDSWPPSGVGPRNLMLPRCDDGTWKRRNR